MDGQLTHKDRLMAYLTATGMRQKEICNAVGVEPVTYRIRRDTVEFQILVEEAHKEIRARIIDRSVRLEDKVNDLAEDIALPTIEELCRGAENESVKLKAAQDIADRSTDMPQKVAGTLIDNRKIIQIPIVALGNMKKALTETGRQEIVDLVEQEEKMIEEGRQAEAMKIFTIEEFEREGAKAIE